jgi:hypothetical protein
MVLCVTMGFRVLGSRFSVQGSGLNSEPQNRRISNRRISKDGIASLVLFYKIDRIPYFDPPPAEYSEFDIQYFLFKNFAGLESYFQSINHLTNQLHFSS